MHASTRSRFKVARSQDEGQTLLPALQGWEKSIMMGSMQQFNRTQSARTCTHTQRGNKRSDHSRRILALTGAPSALTCALEKDCRVVP